MNRGPQNRVRRPSGAPKFRVSIYLVLAWSLTCGAIRLGAQSWEDNSVDPTGTAGALKPQSETGGGFYPHSANASRSVADLDVPGTVGEYGLDFTRHWNSTGPSFSPDGESIGGLPFASGGWTHSWNITATVDHDTSVDDDAFPGRLTVKTIIKVNLSDGSTAEFYFSRHSDEYSGDLYAPPYPSAWSGAPGVSHHLREMFQNGSNFWLYLGDGGTIHFEGGPYGYRATEIRDPHGLSTFLEYNAQQGLLSRVVEPGGRALQFTWDYVVDPTEAHPSVLVLKRVETGSGSGSQAAEFAYSWYSAEQMRWAALTGVQYFYKGVSVPDEYSSYTYVGHISYDTLSPSLIRGSGPLLIYADDSRFAGPMTRIRYIFRGGPGGPTLCPKQTEKPQQNVYYKGDYFFPKAFPVAQELSGATGQTVSSVTIPCNGNAATGTRRESRGAGGERIFYYGHSGGAPPGSSGYGSGYGHFLTKLTEFAANPDVNTPFDFQIDSFGYPRLIFDGRGIATDLIRLHDFTGRVTELRHVGSDASVRKYNWSVPGVSASAPVDANRIRNTYNHWLFSQTDERGHSAAYTRDSLRRVTKIGYYDGDVALNPQLAPVAVEEFTYNTFNQVETHTLPSGAIETKTYYPSGHSWQRLLWKESNSVDGGDPNATIYTYDASNRVETISHAWSRDKGAEFSVKMTYNARSQVLTEEYPATNGGVPPTKEYQYDGYGNCTGIKNELGAWSFYTYDSYRRCTSYTEPLNAPDWEGSGTVASRTWHWVYDRVLADNETVKCASTHTSKKWRLQIAPPYDAAGNRRAIVRNYDYNDRLVFELDSIIQAPNGSWIYPIDVAFHSYEYDENGQKKNYTDPQGRLTTYTYDLRNWLWKTIETKREDQPANPVTETLYDRTGNKELVRFPDGKTQRWENYDAFGQPRKFFDERNNLTDLNYWPWGPMKKLAQVITYRLKDGGGTENQLTSFYYDLMGRPQRTTFPDGTYESRAYQFGQMDVLETRRRQKKSIHYDARGRESWHTWDNNAAPRIDRVWDDAGRLSAISNIFSSIDYGYDDAGQVIWEGNDIAGSGGRTQTNYFRYPNGATGHLHYPGGTLIRQDYTMRGQLEATGWDDGEGTWYQAAHYYYLADGKVNYVNYGNGTTSDPGYDGRGFVNSIEHKLTAGGIFASRTYTRDDRDRIKSLRKGNNQGVNPMENGQGDRFQYDEEGQLTHAWYNAQDPAGNFSGWTRKDYFLYDALGNRSGSSNNVASRNAGSVPISFSRRDNGLNQYWQWSPSVIYHDDNFGAPYVYPGNGVMMADGWITASYNALNQPIAIWSPTYAGTPNFVWFGFDPLGRCVKRWVGESGDVYSNPASYYHYDGWNLLQDGNNPWGPSRVYLHGNRVDEIVASYNTWTGEYGFHHYDARGHCILLTDRGGNILEQYEYDAFGQPYFYDAGGNPMMVNGQPGSAFGNRFLFTGREWLSDLKLYDYRNRMYQPELGRFLQPDPKHFAAGDYNLYRYCHNDPVNRSDPTGLGYDEEMVTSDPVARSEIISAVNARAARAWEQFRSDTLEMLQNPSSWVGPGQIGMARGPKGPLNNLLGKIFPSFRKNEILASLAGPKTGNFGLGSATRAEATSLGRTWVGSGFRVASDGKTLVSRDGLRQYRPPSFKPQLNKLQANFEQRPTPVGPWKRNGHLDITD